MVIIVKCFSKSLLNNYCLSLIEKSKGFGIVLKGMVSLPKKTKSFYGIKIPSCT